MALSDNVKVIIEKLRYVDNGYSEELVRKALQLEEELAPIFLETIKQCQFGCEYNGELIVDFDNYILHIYSIFFLGYWKNHDLVPILFEIFRDEDVDLICDEIFETSYWDDLPVVLAECMRPEDIPLLVSLINDNFYYQFWHYAPITSTFKYLMQMGKISNEELKIIIDKEIIPKLKDDDELIYMKISYADFLMELRFSEYQEICEELVEVQKLLPLCERLFDLEDVKSAFNDEEINWGFEDYQNKTSKKLLLEYMPNWSCFQNGDDLGDADEEFEDLIYYNDSDFDADDLKYFSDRTFVRDMPKTGRNDPCSCGSGKKYKKCCLKNS